MHLYLGLVRLPPTPLKSVLANTVTRFAHLSSTNLSEEAPRLECQNLVCSRVYRAQRA